MEPQVATPPPSVAAPVTPKKDHGLSVILAVLLLLATAIAALLYLQNQKLVKELASYQVPPTAAPSPSATPLPAQAGDPTANWKTYTNTKYNFSIKYPSDWTTQSEGSSPNIWQVFFSPDKAPKGSQQPQIGMTVDSIVFPNILLKTPTDFQQFEQTNGVLKHYKVNKISEKMISISENDAFRYEYEGIEAPDTFHFWGIVIPKNGNVVKISVTDFKVDPSLDTTSIANQILSTFKFINENQ